jgi:hypothetical protein
MARNYREFEAGPDPFGETWQVEFVWLQTAISIRHCDAVDVKFFVTNGAQKRERVVALMHPDLLALSQREGRPISDSWCMKLAGLHIRHMVETGEDFEKTLVTVNPEQLAKYAAMLDESIVARP